LGLTRLRSFLGRHRSIAVDTNVFIYALEANPRYAAFADHVFSWLEQAGHRGVTSTITMTELLVQPYRAGDEQRVNEFYGLLATYPNLDWIAPDLEIADMAARIRAIYGLRTPHALQAATAVRSHATGFVTNDPVFERIDSFETLVLDRVL
jgi:predicted nucleic acid-binding protein